MIAELTMMGSVTTGARALTFLLEGRPCISLSTIRPDETRKVLSQPYSNKHVANDCRMTCTLQTASATAASHL